MGLPTNRVPEMQQLNHPGEHRSTRSQLPHSHSVMREILMPRAGERDRRKVGEKSMSVVRSGLVCTFLLHVPRRKHHRLATEDQRRRRRASGIVTLCERMGVEGERARGQIFGFGCEETYPNQFSPRCGRLRTGCGAASPSFRALCGEG